MLKELSVNNIALIDQLKLPFGSGLNVLTGETGAGKSILVESINFALGSRVKKTMLRSGEKSGYVELLFTNCNSLVGELLSELGIDNEEELLIARTLNSDGRTISRINGRTVTLGMLRQITSQLIDLHGQHEHQSLLEPASHLDLLDLFGGKVVQNLLQKQTTGWKKQQECVREIRKLSVDERELEREVDLLRFQIDEIEEAALSTEEAEELTNRRKRLTHSEKLEQGLRETVWLLSGSSDGTDETISTVTQLQRALSSLEGVTSIDSSLEPLREQLEGQLIQLEDIARELSENLDGIEHDPRELDDIENRLNQIQHLKRKYVDTIPEIEKFLLSMQKRLDNIELGDEKLQQLLENKNQGDKILQEICLELSQIRKKNARQIRGLIEAVLAELAMPHCQFDVQVKQLTEMNETGLDFVEFMISPNRGEPAKPLSLIASGGEMSRIMLAIKSVLAEIDRIDTLIFDEIDTGVSGMTAQKMSERLAVISRCRQVICVTHLAQLAAMGDAHFRIEKQEKQGRTFTTVGPLPDSESMDEIARLLSGARKSAAALENARVMKEEASQYKESLKGSGGTLVLPKKKTSKKNKKTK
jgi:DNA repair protein RecN (Recombination protein N)